MAKTPEGLPATNNPENQQNRLSSVFSFARRLKDITSELINGYKEAPLTEKAALGFLTFAATDMVQVVVNRFTVNENLGNLDIGMIELIADIGMMTAVDDLIHDSPLKKFALVRGSLGLIGSGLAKTGNPDFFMPAMIMAGISGGIGLLSVSNSHSPHYESRI